MHNLNVVDGKAAFAYNSTDVNKPWHGLGEAVFGLMTTEDALKKGRLDYTVEKRELFCNVGADIKVVPDKFAVIRKDTGDVLGTVGNQYTHIQNVDAFKFFDSILSEKQAMMDTVGALGAGERIWALAKLPDDVKVSHDDVVNCYLLLTNSHDGKHNLEAMFTTVRVVCQNTLNMAFKDGKHRIKIRHSKNAEERLKQAHELMGITRKNYEHTNKLFLAMHEKYVTPSEVVTYLNTLFDVEEKKAKREAKNLKRDNSRLDNIIEAVKGKFKAGKGNNGETLWHLYNGLTEWVDHERALKNGENRWISGVFGSGVEIKERAFQLAESMC